MDMNAREFQEQEFQEFAESGLFDEEQLKWIKQGLEKGLDVSWYAKKG